ncbi:MAG TPA: single-stranded-DNA-specific exonuclease RecJ [Candidatus Scatovivens faecipullorum]|nr:single-stranded-DNA-specific exonuclease RecJ [Candidatus Scatovivens faecipullorum]
MNKKWEFYNPNEKKVKEISEKFNVSELLATVLLNRNIIKDEDVKLFLNPTRKDFHDPYLMPDMEKAVNRIITAIDKKEKTIIYGDYDVDGITSITVLSKFLKERNLNVGAYIPNRLEEGYGLNKKAIKKIADEGYKLIITVDCGISGTEEIDYAYSLGMEVIITDHHEPLEVLPKALAVIDCKRKDNKYPFNSLAGVGVAFKLIQAIGIRLDLEEKEYLKFLDIVCIGTISDIVPLVDENRVIAKLGLKLVENTRSPGVKALLNAAAYKEVNSNTVSFGMAPRINACGRMGHERDALDLFLTENIVEANRITEKLNNYNRERQEIEKRIFDEAILKITSEHLMNNNAIVIGSENWHHGVIGIVASKITELYFKPSILICFEGEEGKGSGRSIPGFDLHAALCSTSDYLEKYGGHEMAVGLSLKKSNFQKFRQKFEQIARDNHTEDLVSVIKIDKEINLKDINLENVKQLKLLEPFGEANKTPIFIYKNLKIDSIRALSEGKHLKLTLKDGNTIINAIGFNMGEYSEEFLIGDKIDVIGLLEINTFNGVENVQINMKDLRKSY